MNAADSPGLSRSRGPIGSSSIRGPVGYQTDSVSPAASLYTRSGNVANRFTNSVSFGSEYASHPPNVSNPSFGFRGGARISRNPSRSRIFSSVARTLMTAPSSYIAYLLGNRLGRSPSGTTQMPPPGENDRPQWHTSRVSLPTFASVCLHTSPTDAPCAISLNSRVTWTPAGSSFGPTSFTEPSLPTSAVHSPPQVFGCGVTTSSGP